MDAIPYTRVRNNLAKTMDRVAQDHAPIVITRQKGESVVLMSLEDFAAWQDMGRKIPTEDRRPPP